MTVRSIRNHKQHKIAKIISNDLEKLMKAVEPMMKTLDGYKHYIPASNILMEIRLNYAVMKSQHLKYKRLMEESKND